MSTKNKHDDTTDEEQNPWHALGVMIGKSITDGEPHHHACGGYLVVRDDEGDIHIYREQAHAETVEELPDGPFDRVQEWYDWVTANEFVATISAPEGGWDDEVGMVSEDIWSGFN